MESHITVIADVLHTTTYSCITLHHAVALNITTEKNEYVIEKLGMTFPYYAMSFLMTQER